jgi:DNA polymerase-4
MNTERFILHVDMDAFFASVEQLDDPALRGKPVLVGGRGRRGVVAAASYEARRFGCRSAQPTAVALRLCPHAVVLRPRGARYRELSDRVMSILESTSPLVQPISIDEAFVDVTGSIPLLGPAVGIAKTIRARIREETGLTASVGVAPNKFLAKLASDLNKPDGLTIIEPGRVHDTLDPLPVSKLWGVGPAAEKSLARLGVRTIGDLRAVPEPALAARLGDFGHHLARLARGEDDRPVHADHEAKSISHEQTFAEDLRDPDEVRRVMLAQCEDVARRLRRHHRLARTVTVKIRFGDFETITRAEGLGEPTDLTETIWAAARALFDRWTRESFRPVRLIGVGVSHLTDPASGRQLGLFEADRDERGSRLDSITDAIIARHGKGAIRRAGAIEKAKGHWGPGSEDQAP